MKKEIIISLLIILVIFTITGCRTRKDVTNNNSSYNSSDLVNINSIVIFFSATGTTKSIAQRIAKESNSDIIEIIPKVKYSSSDLDYNSDCRANREQNDVNARPEIANSIDISLYDTVYLGYPIWWGTNPKIILTLLDTYDFTGKNIIPFCTSGSSEINKSISDLRNYNSKLNIKDGTRFSLNDTDEKIRQFISINNTNDKIKVTINEKDYIINLENNETVNSFIKMLPQKLNMMELNGNEKYVYLDTTLPVDSYSPKRINAGDVMLYGNNCLVIFYKSFDTSYNYTKIGHIDNLEELGNDNITVIFEK